MDKVSVIIPTYNREQTILRAIQSVLNQTYSNIEVLVIDDGSTDGTADIVNGIADDRVKYVVLEQNGGPSRARNIGVELANGEWIAFQDSDDCWHNDKLEVQLAYAKEHPEYSLIYCMYNLYTLDGEQLLVPPKPWPNIMEGSMLPTLLKGNAIGAPTIFVKKEAFLEVGGFDTSYQALEDWEFAIRFSIKYLIGFVDRPLMECYTSDSGVSSRYDATYDAKCKMLATYKKEMMQEGLFEPMMRAILVQAEKAGILERIKDMMMFYLSQQVDKESRRMDFCEQSGAEFENSLIKNSFIHSTDGDCIWFVDTAITSRRDIEQILQENDFLSEYDVVVFCSEVWSGEIGLMDLMENPQGIIYSIGVKRKLLTKTGSFNQFLEENGNYEFLLRAAEVGTIFAVSCTAEKEYVFEPYTMAYIVRRYMSFLKENDSLDRVFLQMANLAECMGKETEFNQTMNVFLGDTKEYEKIAGNTAPCLIFVGDNICSGVLAGFAKTLADELVALGQNVITTDGRYGDYDNIPTDKLLNQQYKAIIGFQAPIFAKPMLREMNGKKIQFWFDNPVFSKDVFDKHIKNSFVFCQDRNYAEFIKINYDMPNAVQFPPGGTVVNGLSNEKIYDVTFVGNYEQISESIYEDTFEKGFFEYMCGQPDATFEQGMREYLLKQNILFEELEVPIYLKKVRRACQNVLHLERHRMIEKIVSSGIKLHVFSDNWNLYQGEGRENLIIHPMIYGEEPYRVWAQSKIGLNIMRGHRAGMTERVANIMLCGTCCLSDETTYLREHFEDGENIVLFKRTELDVLPEKILYLLEHDEKREKIAAAGYRKAFTEHTWNKRAQQLLELLDK